MTYILPSGTIGLPKGLTLTQFIQTVLVGLSEIPGDLVRPKWQPSPPKQPDIGANWIAYGINSLTPDSNSFVGTDSAGVTHTQRHERVDIGCSFYGPRGLEIADLVRDGFQIQTNLEALRSANMGFVEVGPAMLVPDLVNERFINRVEMGVVLRRETIRTYPIVTLLSANGTVHSVLQDGQYLLNWNSENARQT